MKQIGALFAISVMVFFLTGCSSKPSDSEIKNAYFANAGLNESGSNEQMDIKNFTKLNGIQNNDGTYTANVRFDVIFKFDNNRTYTYEADINMIKSEKGWIMKDDKERFIKLAQALPKLGDIWWDPVTTGMEFVWVSGGCYEMGCGSWTSDCENDEKPVHEVCVQKDKGLLDGEVRGNAGSVEEGLRWRQSVEI